MPVKSVLEGYKILDCSIAMSGPFAAQRLGDLGAEVIKVEPVTGEWQRHVAAGGARGNEINVSFMSLNRNKKSIAVDLKAADGKQALYDLVRDADVFLQNYRPGVAGRLGVDYETLKAINPKLIYVSISGYGEDGPYVQRPGQDLLLQAMSGAMLSTGREGEPPSPSGQYIVDAVAASTAFEAVLAALLHRERTGEGQAVRVNMLDAIVTLQMQELSVYLAGVEQKRSAEPHAHVYIRAPYGVFETKSGFMALAFPKMKDLGDVFDEPRLSGMDDEIDTFVRRDEIFSICRDHLKARTTDEWIELFAPYNIWAGPVYGYADLLADPQIVHNGTFLSYDHPTEGKVTAPAFPYQFSETPASVRYGAPVVGQHTREVLADIGYDAATIERLMSDGVIKETTV
ncbi:MAG: CoA transferase [Rhodospirillales bacterium]|jgi:crotonobetainyl-CoA:carnitine CoA-transferase CaiB-like acyl-CoA transferase|nr:CoA transferase [Rhodospirillales bacterium]